MARNNTALHQEGFLTRDFIKTPTGPGHAVRRFVARNPLTAEPALLLTAFFLLSFGLLMIYSTTGVVAQERFGDSLLFLRKQIIAALIGLFLLVICSYVSVTALRRVATFAYLLALLCAFLPLIPGLGLEAGGASRWVAIGPVRFQPGEFSKLFFVLFLAGYYSRHEKHMSSFVTGLLVPMALFIPVAGFLLLQPDFGSTAVIGVVALALACAAGVRLRHIILIGFGLLCCAAILVMVSPYRMSRIISFLSPWQDASGKGYQLIQSLIAVGSGEVTGVGIGASQQKLFFLPAAHTDFIFAVICEELGFLGGVAIVAAFGVILWRGMRVCSQLAQDSFLFSLAFGLTALIVIPAFLNMGVVTGLLPTKGLVLPLVGYGGSSLIMSLLSIGLLLALARTRRIKAPIGLR